MHHFIERRRDQSTEPDNIDFLFAGGPQYFICWHHHPEVNNVIIVTCQHDTHNVLADVMHISFDGSHQNFPFDTGFTGLFVCFQVGSEIRHCQLHHPRTLYHLGKEHLTLAK